MSNGLIAWITSAIVYGSVIMYGALGETLTEKAGNLNLGTPGIMAIGAGFGFAGAFVYETHAANPNPALIIIIALACGFFSAFLAGALYSLFTISFRVNQNITGLTLTIFGVGLAKFFGTFVIPAGATSTRTAFGNKVFTYKIFGFADEGFLKIFFDYGFMTYVVIILAILMTVVLNKTRVGLNLRAVGESPATADAAGINVTKYKYLATCIGSGITGIGGVYYVLDFSGGTWATATGDSVEALAWLSVALVIFATWKPVNLIWGSYIFGFCFWTYNYIYKVVGLQVDINIAQMLPYVVTIIVLIISSIRSKKENQGPASLGLSYFREER